MVASEALGLAARASQLGGSGVLGETHTPVLNDHCLGSDRVTRDLRFGHRILAAGKDLVR